MAKHNEPLQHPQAALTAALQEIVQAAVAAELDRRGLTGAGKSPAEYRMEARRADGAPWSVADLADAIGCAHATILNLESGQLARMQARTFEVMDLIAEQLNVDAGQYRAAVERQRQRKQLEPQSTQRAQRTTRIEERQTA